MTLSTPKTADALHLLRDGFKRSIAIVGAGPSALYVLKALVDRADAGTAIDIFEASSRVGGGMPYSTDGANIEHVTNVSCDEVPPLVTSVRDWLATLTPELLDTFQLPLERFHEQKVLPRLLFGGYLENQFELLVRMASDAGMPTTLHREARVVDVIDNALTGTATLELEGGARHAFDRIVICSGHNWPRAHEGVTPGYFDSPYPPVKLANRYNAPVALRGSALTAVDAIRTLARHNGAFVRDAHGVLHFEADADAPDFRIVMHSRHGLLPCVRMHTDTPELGSAPKLSRDEIAANMRENDGFLSLDFLFEKGFKEPLREQDPDFFARIETMRLEEFVETMLAMREAVDAFSFFRGEYAESLKSIRRKQSVPWKEMLSDLSFAMNYPAKHMSAEDMYRHQRVLMPLISIVIAFVPQNSCEELLALHSAGRLDLVAVGDDSSVDVRTFGGVTYTYRDHHGNTTSSDYDTFVDCIGQPHLSIPHFPFPSLVQDAQVARAQLRFRSEVEGARMRDEGNADVELGADGAYYLNVSGVAINDSFQVVDAHGTANPRVFLMAVPYIGGYNPDYSGLDFCQEAGGLVVNELLEASSRGAGAHGAN